MAMPRPSAKHWKAGPRRFSPSQSISGCFAEKLTRALNAPRDLRQTSGHVGYWPLADMAASRLRHRTNSGLSNEKMRVIPAFHRSSLEIRSEERRVGKECR